jgi:hypothetical protein
MSVCELHRARGRDKGARAAVGLAPGPASPRAGCVATAERDRIAWLAGDKPHSVFSWKYSPGYPHLSDSMPCIYANRPKETRTASNT